MTMLIMMMDDDDQRCDGGHDGDKLKTQRTQAGLQCCAAFLTQLAERVNRACSELQDLLKALFGGTGGPIQ